jgi:hypothetical protein
MNGKTYLGMALIAAATALLWFALNGTNKTALHKGVVANTAASAGSVVQRESGTVLGSGGGSTKGAHLTYQPGVKRNINQYPGPVEVGKTGTGWWLLARSTAEADWLDLHGYPTPTEEKLLAGMSDAELKSRSDAGDQNASTHIAIRSAKGAFLSRDKIQIEAATNGLGFALNLGGPYAASKTLEFSAELLAAYSALPNKDRTESMRKALREFSVYREIAAALSIAHGDHTIDLLYSQFTAPPDLKLATASDVDARSIALSIANASLERANAGRTPLTFVPRPLPPEISRGDPGKYREFPVVFERR